MRNARSYFVHVELIHQRVEARENGVHGRDDVHRSFDGRVIKVAQFAEENRY